MPSKIETKLNPDLRVKVEARLKPIKAANIEVTPAIFGFAKRAVRLGDRLVRIDLLLARKTLDKDRAEGLRIEREERELETRFLDLKLHRIANG